MECSNVVLNLSSQVLIFFFCPASIATQEISSNIARHDIIKSTSGFRVKKSSIQTERADRVPSDKKGNNRGSNENTNMSAFFERVTGGSANPFATQVGQLIGWCRCLHFDQGNT